MGVKCTFHEHDKEMIRYLYPNIILSIVFRLTKFFRSKKIWVFGCWDGRRYDDNTRYLFEYVSKFHPEIQSYWITRDEDIYKELSTNGLKVCMSGTKNARRVMLRCGVSFYTNVIYDFDKIAYVMGSKIIYLCHGSGGSKMQRHNYNKYKVGTIKYYLRSIYQLIELNLFNWQYFDYAIVPSDFCGILKAETFSIKKPGKIISLGFPRNDVFFNDTNYKKKIGIDERSRYLLYMPTFRVYENEVLQKFYDEMYSDQEYMDFLYENNYVIIIKPHNAEKYACKMENSKNICVVSSDKIKGTQELLAACDVLITDYSSCCTDFALKEAPILLYTPDWKEYDQKEGLTDYWKSLIRKHAYSDINGLKKAIKKYILQPELECNLTSELNEKYRGNPLEKNETYSSRVYSFVNTII